MLLARQNFATESEVALNQQINSELCASYTYLAMATYFRRDGIALHGKSFLNVGFAKLFKESADEEREHAEKLIEYVSKRGGIVTFHPIPEPMVSLL